MDWYLEDKNRLKGQPKRTIGDYVEQNGILVPKRFDSLDEARASGLAIIARSEHTQDYDGSSGVLNSPILDKPEEISYEELKSKMLKNSMFAVPYCRLHGINSEDFGKEVSLSFWEHLQGFNSHIITDSAVKERYHITTTGIDSKEGFFFNYVLINKGSVVRNLVQPLPNELMNNLGNLVEIYETVRNLERFDPNHCPIMEFQVSNGKNYFLQYHKTRDFKETTFKLERPVEEGETEAQFVRGATPPEGTTCNALVYYSASYTKLWDKIIQTDEASFDFHYNYMYSEAVYRQRKLQLRLFEHSLDWSMAKLYSHTGLSTMFKPEVYLMINESDNIPGKDERTRMVQGARNGVDQSIKVRVVSDGTRAYIKRI